MAEEQQQQQQPADHATLASEPVDGAFARIAPEALVERSRGILVMPDLESRRTQGILVMPNLESRRAQGILAMPDLESRCAHRLTQQSFRAWCVCCTTSRGRGEHHRRSTRESTRPAVGIDHCFPALDGHDPLTVFVITEIYSEAVESAWIDARSVASFPERGTVQPMGAWGSQCAGSV